MISPGRSSVSQREVLSKISEAQIANYYLGITTIPCLINSPIRKDSHPSFGIYATADNRIRYTDFSTHEAGDIINLLSLMWKVDYFEALKIIKNDSKNFSKKPKMNISVTEYINGTTRNNTDIQVKIRDWEDYDIDYWKSYGISLKWLQYAEVYPIVQKIIIKDGKQMIFGADKYAYVYVEHKDNIVSLKVYQPFNKEFKWSNKSDKSIWSLWTKIPKEGDTLIISSSLKDCLNLWSNLKIPSICMQGEGYLPKPKVMQELKSRYKNIIVFYDNDFKSSDNPGRTNSIKLCKKYGLKRVEIPENYGCKDPSDLYKTYGKKKYLEIMKEIFNNIETYEQEDSQY